MNFTLIGYLVIISGASICAGICACICTLGLCDLFEYYQIIKTYDTITPHKIKLN